MSIGDRAAFNSDPNILFSFYLKALNHFFQKLFELFLIILLSVKHYNIFLWCALWNRDKITGGDFHELHFLIPCHILRLEVVRIILPAQSPSFVCEKERGIEEL